MPSAFDIISLVLSVLGLSGLCKAVKEAIARCQPPGRLREIKDALAAMLTLINDIERGGRLSGAESAEGMKSAESYRSRLKE